MKKFLAEFQAFISRGNVLDLAVAVIIGAAFNGIVTSLVKDIVNPIVGFLVGKPDFTNLFWVLKRPEGYTGPETYEALTAAGARSSATGPSSRRSSTSSFWPSSSSGSSRWSRPPA